MEAEPPNLYLDGEAATEPIAEPAWDSVDSESDDRPLQSINIQYALIPTMLTLRENPYSELKLLVNS